MKKGDKINIVLSNAWSYYNKGDGAIVVSMIKNISSSFPSAHFSIIAFDPASFELSKKHGEIPKEIKIFPAIACSKMIRNILLKDRAGIISLFLLIFLPIIIKIFQFFDLTLKNTIQTLERADVIVSCGGNQLHSNGGFTFLRNLYPILYGKLICKKKVMIFSQSIGPIRDYFGQKLLKFFLERVDVITLRENVSKAYLLDVLKIKNLNIFVTADALFMLDLSTPSDKFTNRLDFKRVGFTVRQWFFRDRDSYKNYIEVIASFINYLIQVHDVEIRLFSFSQLPRYGEDILACQEVYDLVAKKNRLKIIQLGNLSIKEVVKEFKKIHALIGTRMHSVIFSSLINIPTVVISYQHHKGQGISKMLELTKSIRIETITLNQLIDAYKKLKDFSPLDLKSNVQNLRSKSEENIRILKKLLESNIPGID